MYKIALTGPIGAGKGYVCALLGNICSQRGINLQSVDTDKIVHELYRTDSALTSALAEAFGADMVTSDGTIDREKLMTVVMNDSEKLQLLNSIVHARVVEQCVSWLESQRSNKADIALVEIPLLAESGASYLFDSVITVAADREVRLNRAIARGLPAWKVELVMSRQLSDEAYAELADHIIRNGESDDLALQLSALLHKIIEIPGAAIE